VVAGDAAFGALEQTSPEELRPQPDTNVVGVHRVTRAVLPAMRARRAGAIVKTDLHVKEIRAGAAGRSDSPYAPLLAAYQRQVAGLRRDDLGELMDVIYRAATFPHPKLRWPVGPTSITAGRLRALCPDRLYEWLMRIAFRIRAPRL